jgi:predicted nucleotidyltransferase
MSQLVNTPAAQLVSYLRSALESAPLPFSVRGAILFGSTAAGKSSGASDVDLLAVAPDLPLSEEYAREDAEAAGKKAVGAVKIARPFVYA